MHPWITRRFEEKIPLTAGEEIQIFNQEQVLQKAIKTVLFLSIMSKNKDEKLTALLQRKNSSPSKLKSLPISQQYLEKIKSANEGKYSRRKKRANFESPMKTTNQLSQISDSKTFKTEVKMEPFEQ